MTSSSWCWRPGYARACAKATSAASAMSAVSRSGSSSSFERRATERTWLPLPSRAVPVLEQHAVLEPQAHLAVKGSDEAEVAAAHAIWHTVPNSASRRRGASSSASRGRPPRRRLGRFGYEAAQLLGDGLHRWRVAGEEFVRGWRQRGAWGSWHVQLLRCWLQGSACWRRGRAPTVRPVPGAESSGSGHGVGWASRLLAASP